jgi:hypothetical protein
MTLSYVDPRFDRILSRMQSGFAAGASSAPPAWGPAGGT